MGFIEGREYGGDEVGRRGEISLMLMSAIRELEKLNGCMCIYVLLHRTELPFGYLCMYVIPH